MNIVPSGVPRLRAGIFEIFGNIRDTSRWDREVGRAAGDAEMKRMNEWFRQQRPGSGEVVIEVHPGIYLPRGSITKVLGHEFDVNLCAEGYGFKELCVDYPQGWDWGVPAWVQWRHLKVQIEGLQERNGIFALHLHAFDPGPATFRSGSIISISRPRRSPRCSMRRRACGADGICARPRSGSCQKASMAAGNQRRSAQCGSPTNASLGSPSASGSVPWKK